MNKFKSGVAIAAALVVLSACKQESGGLSRAADIPQTDDHKQSYALGQSMGNSLRQAQVEIESSYFNAGFYDAMDGEMRMPQEEMQAALVALQTKTQEAQGAKREELLVANSAKAAENLAANAKEDGIVTTESGLQYRIVTKGEGAVPAAADTVTVHYEGRLFSGTVFDSSIERGEPATFPVQGVIPGWTEALQLMPVGSKWELFIPPALAYAERGAGAVIEPNSALVFDVELLEILPKQAAEPAAENFDADIQAAIKSAMDSAGASAAQAAEAVTAE